MKPSIFTAIPYPVEGAWLEPISSCSRTMTQTQRQLCRNCLVKKQSAGILFIMDCPAQSQDLNPIELLWEQLQASLTCGRCFRKHWVKTSKKLTTQWVCKALTAANGGLFDESKVWRTWLLLKIQDEFIQHLKNVINPRGKLSCLVTTALC